MENQNASSSESVIYDSDNDNSVAVDNRSPDDFQGAQFSASALAAAAIRECPNVNTINIDKSRGVHIGPKIVSVVQHVDNNEKVQGRILGLHLVSLKNQTHRLRCSVAVFSCWTFIVAIILTLFLIFTTLSGPPQRLDIGLFEPWYVRRAEWQAREDYHREELRTPVSTVVLGHSAESYCSSRYHCISVVLAIQDSHLGVYDDIGPNFLVGGTGLIFEGRGSNLQGVMIKGWNSKMISIMFLGNYNIDKPDDEQIEHVSKLLNVLVDEKLLTNNYDLLGHCQITQIPSPGENIKVRLKEFKHFNDTNIKTCPIKIY